MNISSILDHIRPALTYHPPLLISVRFGPCKLGTSHLYCIASTHQGMVCRWNRLASTRLRMIGRWRYLLNCMIGRQGHQHTSHNWQQVVHSLANIVSIRQWMCKLHMKTTSKRIGKYQWHNNNYNQQNRASSREMKVMNMRCN